MNTPAPATVLASVALVVSLGGTASATNSAARIRAHSITARQIKPHSLTAGVFRKGVLLRGAAGPRGADGAAGTVGAPGLRGPSDGYGDTAFDADVTDVPATLVSRPLPAGSYFVAASFSLDTKAAGPASTADCYVVPSPGGGFILDEAYAHLAAAGNPGDQQHVVLQSIYRSDTPWTATLQCSDPVGTAVKAARIRISAIALGSADLKIAESD